MLLSQENKNVNCKYCGTHEVIKYGSYNETPRYFCKLCRRKFKDDDHVFHMGVPATHIDCVLNSYYSGMCVSEIKNNVRRNFDHYPSATLIHSWIDKYTLIAKAMTKYHHPQVGDTWTACEKPIRLNGKKIWLYEIVDYETDFLLVSRISPTRTKFAMSAFIQGASEVCRRMPKIVMVYMAISRFNSSEKGSGYVFEHVPREAFAELNRIGILSNTNRYRLRNLSKLRSVKQADKFFKGLAIHYNYFESNEKLKGKTPAEAARIDYPFNSWKDLIEQSARFHSGFTCPPLKSPVMIS